MTQYCDTDEAVARAVVQHLNAVADGLMAARGRLPTDYLRGKVADVAGAARAVAREIKEDVDGQAKAAE